MARTGRVSGLLGWCVAAAVGCGGGGGSVEADAVPTPGVDAAPAVDAAGPEAPASDRCLTAAECTAPGAVCTCEGRCEVPTGTACTEDRNCGVPRFCNTCTGHCEAQADLCEPCEVDAGCVDGGACLPFASGGRFCGRPCLSAAGCPRGYRCAELDGLTSAQCVPESGSCGAVTVCAGDGDCPLGRICEARSGQCVAGCEDGGCPNGELCVAGRCTPPCASNADCAAPAVCEPSGKCRVPGACEAREDCPEPETFCDRATGRCADGCREDLDCQDAARVCREGQCVAKGCTANYTCAFGQVCDASGSCVPYPTSEPYCAACDASASGGGGACPEPNLCVTFQDDQGQPLGDHCLVPCKADPDRACPSGWQCQRFDDPEGGAARFFCARPCYLAPVGAP